MRRCALTLILLALTAIGTVLCAQNALVQLEFEDAEKCYNNGNFQEAAQHLDAVEQKAGVTSKTLYLRIMIENSLFQKGTRLYTDQGGFMLLAGLRKHATKYLDALSSQEIDDKYREVYRIADALKAFPENTAEWEEGKKAYQRAEAEKTEKQKAAGRLAALEENRRLRVQELALLNSHQITLRQIKYHQLATMVDGQASTEPLSTHCTVYFYREPILLGRWVNTKVFVNDQLAFPLATKCFKKVLFLPGLVKINGLHGTFKDIQKKRNKRLYDNSTLAVALEAGKTYYVSTQMQKDGRISLHLISEQTAPSKIAAYKEMEQ